jgi:mono/diheme cytochrome c family protein
MRMKSWLATLALVSVSGSGAIAQADAAATYDKMCKSCHGADGKGDAAKAKALKIAPEKLNLGRAEAANLSRDDLKKILLDGKEKMPGYAKKVKPDEVDALVDHSMKLAAAIRGK